MLRQLSAASDLANRSDSPDINLPGGESGLDLLKELGTRQDAPPIVIMITAHGPRARGGPRRSKAEPTTTSREPLSLRSSGWSSRTLSKRGLRSENEQLREEIAAIRGAGDLLGASANMRTVYQMISKVAVTDVTVLIQGNQAPERSSSHEQSMNRVYTGEAEHLWQ